MDIIAMQKIVGLAVPLANAALRAVESASNGDIDAAHEHLKEARQRFEDGSSAWDEAAIGDEK